jgi:hypothetical protein
MKLLPLSPSPVPEMAGLLSEAFHTSNGGVFAFFAQKDIRF